MGARGVLGGAISKIAGNRNVRYTQLRICTRESGNAAQRDDGSYQNPSDAAGFGVEVATSISLSPVEQKQGNAGITDRADRQPVRTTDLDLAKSLW